jgi:hypothetical protein
MSYREKYFSDYHAEPQLRPNGKASKSIMHIMVIGINGIFRQRHNGKVIKVDTFKTKASQFDHTDDSFTKKKLSQRFAKLSDGTVVQRDLYSAFLLAHLDDKHETYDKAAIGSDFPHFIEMHDKTKEHLQNSHDWLPASVGF